MSGIPPWGDHGKGIVAGMRNRSLIEEVFGGMGSGLVALHMKDTLKLFPISRN